MNYRQLAKLFWRCLNLVVVLQWYCRAQCLLTNRRALRHPRRKFFLPLISGATRPGIERIKPLPILIEQVDQPVVTPELAVEPLVSVSASTTNGPRMSAPTAAPTFNSL